MDANKIKLISEFPINSDVTLRSCNYRRRKIYLNKVLLWHELSILARSLSKAKSILLTKNYVQNNGFDDLTLSVIFAYI